MKQLRYLLPICLLSLAAALPAQVYNLRGTDVSLSGTGLYTSSITNQGPNLPHQTTTSSAGFLFTFRDHPITKLDIEVNYQYSSFTEKFTNDAGFPIATVPLAFHEGTAAYVLRSHDKASRPFRPRAFVAIGGGVLYFNPSSRTNTQLRSTGLFDIGTDIHTHNPHLTYRVQGRALFYRAPNFNQPALASSRWVATYEPALGVAFHY